MHNFKQKEEEVEIHADHNVIILKSDFLADPKKKKKIITAKGYKQQQHILKHKLKLSRSLNKIG